MCHYYKINYFIEGDYREVPEVLHFGGALLVKVEGSVSHKHYNYLILLLLKSAAKLL